VHDHIIVGKQAHTSLKGLRLIYGRRPSARLPRPRDALQASVRRSFAWRAMGPRFADQSGFDYVGANRQLKGNARDLFALTRGRCRRA
jgi:hypothetical protein